MTKITTFLQYTTNDILIVILNVVKDLFGEIFTIQILNCAALVFLLLTWHPAKSGDL